MTVTNNRVAMAIVLIIIISKTANAMLDLQEVTAKKSIIAKDRIAVETGNV